MFPAFIDRRHWRRGIAFALALIVEALFLLAFLFPVSFGSRTKERELTTISVLPEGIKNEPTRAAAKAKSASTEKPLPRPKPVPATKSAPPSMIEVSRADFAAGDISKLAANRGESDSSKGASASYGPGEGPGGAPLYNAEWYVEPTPGQLALYLPGGRAAPGWALIVCQTIPNYRVENCRQLGESPPGSGLSRALRQAAWQFRVRPPRVGGKPIIGAWVRIRFDWLEQAKD